VIEDGGSSAGYLLGDAFIVAFGINYEF